MIVAGPPRSAKVPPEPWRKTLACLPNHVPGAPNWARVVSEKPPNWKSIRDGPETGGRVPNTIAGLVMNLGTGIYAHFKASDDTSDLRTAKAILEESDRA